MQISVNKDSENVSVMGHLQMGLQDLMAKLHFQKVINCLVFASSTIFLTVVDNGTLAKGYKHDVAASQEALL